MMNTNITETEANLMKMGLSFARSILFVIIHLGVLLVEATICTDSIIPPQPKKKKKLYADSVVLCV